MITNIEFAHVYTNTGITDDVHTSISIVKDLIKNKLPEVDIQLSVMVDDYSPDGMHDFNDNRFLFLLKGKNLKPNLFIKESDLVGECYAVLKSMCNCKEKTEIQNYLDTHSKLPCSLFTATWYMIRLGIISYVDFGLFNAFKPAQRLINVLPYYVKKSEDKAMKILGKFGVNINLIDNVYFGSQDEINWNSFQPKQYVKNNYHSVKTQDLVIFATLFDFHKANANDGHMLEVGGGPNLYPLIAACGFYSEITVIEYSDTCIKYLENQIVNMDNNWKSFIKLLGILAGIEISVKHVQSLLREKVKVEKGSIYDLPKDKYDAVSMHFVAESITDNKRLFFEGCKSFQSACKQGGNIVASFMAGSKGYSVNESNFPSVDVNSIDIDIEFELDNKNLLNLPNAWSPVRSGYTGMIVLTGNKK